MELRRLAQGLPVVAAALLAHRQAASQIPIVVSYADLCVTEGALEEGADRTLIVTTPAMRAFAKLKVADTAEVRFSYLGATTVESRLGSGVIRRQFGLKLRARDPCNLVYVMWRIAPESKLVVQVKSNPAEQSSSQCLNHGYQTIKPRLTGLLPPLVPGQTHVLRAQISGRDLHVTVDGRTVWQGDLGARAAELVGPVGVRSDNARVAFNLTAGPGPALEAAQMANCRTGPEMTE
jgi:hypothetical protein